MENVLIVSVVKHSDKNNNKAYILKNTATQTKCRTFRELYQEAIERCSDAQSEIINIKTIQISKSNSFDDSSIKISNVGYVGISMLVCFGVIYFLIFNCKVALARTPSFHCAWIDWLVIHMHKHKTHTMQLCYKKLASILQRVSKDQKVHILQMKAVHIKSR